MKTPQKTLSKVSRLLAQVLRHAPEKLGLELDANGWVDVATLRDGLTGQGYAISQADIAQIVATSDKKRFTLSDDGLRIRAAQGHSVTVDLGVAAVEPPAILFHGTARQTVALIMKDGLRAMSRQQVHLSADRETATKVGSRHGTPIVLAVDTARMFAAGHGFFQADNGVWLTDRVPAEYICINDA